jgi:hypothetical protein
VWWCRYSAALLSDLGEARGYAILKLMVLESSPSRRPEVLARLVQLVGKPPSPTLSSSRDLSRPCSACLSATWVCGLAWCAGAGAENVSERHDRGGGGPEDAWAVGQQARNAKAFDVIRDVLLEATPFLAKALGGTVRTEQPTSTGPGTF